MAALIEATDARAIHYCVHHNWMWVIEAAIKERLRLPGVKVTRSRDLPSRSSGAAAPGSGYALFRLEEAEGTRESAVRRIWACSGAFDVLDAKDELYRRLGHLGVMPDSELIPWNWAPGDEAFPQDGGGATWMMRLRRACRCLPSRRSHASSCRRFLSQPSARLAGVSSSLTLCTMLQRLCAQML